LFENFIVGEHIKQKFHRRLPVEYYFWRDKTGHEIDLLGVKGPSMWAIEIKAGKTVVADYFSDINYFDKIQDSRKKLIRQVIYGGDASQKRQGVMVLGKDDFLRGTGG